MPPVTGAAGPSPVPVTSPDGSAGPPAELTGHWAVAGTSGFDIEQDGGRFAGSSVAGLSFGETLAGRHADFVFWQGSSFARADPADRGSGSFEVSPDGNQLFVTLSPAELRQNIDFCFFLADCFESWDWAHGIKPRRAQGHPD